MSRINKILLINDQPQQLKDFSYLLAFMDEPFIATDSSQWLDSVAELQASRDVLCAFVGGLKDKNAFCTLLKELAEWDENLPIVLLGDAEADCPADLKRRILCTLQLPTTYNRFLDSLHRAQVYRDVYDEVSERRSQREANLFRSLVGTSRSVHKVRQMMQQVADTEANVLILGESGTGKEVVARNLHYSSSRRDGPFVPVNCGAIPAELLESELFGHEKGAFTGAISARAGRFEMAKGGTLFLDEVGDMPLPMQVKLLRVIQERVFERVGSTKTLNADIRIVAATHKNLEKMIETGDFREDLFYRLNVFPIEMPPLRERSEDIPLLINELVMRMENEKRGSIRFNSAAIMSFSQHDWSGNVRELANLVERMAIMHPHGVIGVNELPKKFRYLDEEEELQDLREELSERAMLSAPLVENELQAEVGGPVLPAEGLDLRDYLADIEKDLIQQALDETDGVVAHAAERLNIRRTTLVEKMRKYEMSR